MRSMTLVAAGVAASIALVTTDTALGDTSDAVHVGGLELSLSEKPTNEFGKGPSLKLTYNGWDEGKVWVEMHPGGGGVYGRMPMPESFGGGGSSGGGYGMLDMLLSLF